MNKLLKDLPILSNEIDWGFIKLNFSLTDEYIDDRLVSNVSVIPFIGDKYVVIQIDNGNWEIAGGTLEPFEYYKDAIKREVMEEVGAELTSFKVFGQFNCTSSADKPFRPHIPHPQFVRLVGFGEVKLVREPLNPPDGEKVIAVDIVEIEEAIKRFENQNRFDIAELYKLANLIRKELL